MKSSLFCSLLFLAIASNATIAMAQSSGTFTATGNLTTARQGHTATLLTTGKVLITGGANINIGKAVSLASAELYDPSTGTFTATGYMHTARSYHTATLLPNGKVLVADDSYFNSSSELYDPSTGTFTATGEMTTARSEHTATLLPNGKVLVAGGFGFNSALASAELYDPSTGIFTATGEMTTPGSYLATLLANGKVLMADRSDRGRGNAELYDPDTGTFSLTGRSTHPEMFPVTASLLTSGKVLFTLESDDLGGSSMELYDPSTGAFKATGEMAPTPLNPPALDHTATLLPDGSVLLAGIEHAKLYLATGAVAATGDILTGRGSHGATLLPDGTVLMSGGWVCCGTTLGSAELYHPTVSVSSPSLFSLTGDGRGQGAVWDGATGLVASPDNPATAGEVLSMYCTSLIEGSVIPPQVAVGGRLAEILFFGIAPGYPGYYQVNFRVPGGVAPGPAVPVSVTYLSRPSNEVTIGVR